MGSPEALPQSSLSRQALCLPKVFIASLGYNIHNQAEPERIKIAEAPASAKLPANIYFMNNLTKTLFTKKRILIL